jgi:hypothetical protein
MAKVEKRNQNKFRINPIEIIIASTLGAVFVQSLYQILYQGPIDPNSSALVPMKAKPTSEGRTTASAHASPLINIQMDCAKGPDSNTQASKARIQGELCGMKSAEEGIKLNSATVTNASNQFVATVFAQNDSNQFSTDYIPLLPGPNKIHVEFSFSGGVKPYSQDLTIIKN